MRVCRPAWAMWPWGARRRGCSPRGGGPAPGSGTRAKRLGQPGAARPSARTAHCDAGRKQRYRARRQSARGASGLSVIPPSTEARCHNRASTPGLARRGYIPSQVGGPHRLQAQTAPDPHRTASPSHALAHNSGSRGLTLRTIARTVCLVSSASPHLGLPGVGFI